MAEVDAICKDNCLSRASFITIALQHYLHVAHQAGLTCPLDVEDEPLEEESLDPNSASPRPPHPKPYACEEDEDDLLFAAEEFQDDEV